MEKQRLLEGHEPNCSFHYIGGNLHDYSVGVRNLSNVKIMPNFANVCSEWKKFIRPDKLNDVKSLRPLTFQITRSFLKTVYKLDIAAVTVRASKQRNHPTVLAHARSQS